MRESVVALAREGGVPDDRVGDVAVVIDELVTNSMIHGCNRAEVRAWTSCDFVVFEVCDGSRLRDPLAGRRRPALDNESGRGLWIVNQISDLVQQRTFGNNTVTPRPFATSG